MWEVDTAAGASITAEPASAAITWLRFNPDGKRIVGEMGSALALWNSETGQLIGELKGHKGSIRDETFSHDGRLLASWAWDDPDVRLWEPQSGSVKVLPGTTDGKAPAITGARFSEQGARLVTRSADSVWLWDTATGYLVAKLAGLEGLLKRVDIHDNGTRLLTTGQKEKSARLWDAANKGELVGVLGGHIGELEQAAFNKEGNRILTTAKGDASVRLWNAIDGSLIREMKKHNTPVLSAFFDASGSRIVTRAENDTVVMLWDANSGDLVNQLEGHTGQVRFARLDAAGTLLVTTGAADKVVRLWDTKSGALAASLDGHGGIITDMQFSPDGLRLLSRASNDEAARLWDLSGRDNLKSFPLRGYALSGAAIEEKGDVAAIYESSGPAFERPGSVLLARAGETMTTITLSGHTKAVRDVTLYANGKRLLSSEGDENNPSTELKLWNTETGDLLNTVIHGGKGIPLNSVRISADGQQLVTRAEGSASLHLWNGMTGEHIKELTGHRAPVTAAFMTENGVRLISQARGDKAILVWDGKTGARVSPGQLEGHATSVARFVVASKGDRFATAAEGSAVIKLWNGATGTLIGDLAGHAGTSIESMAFSKDDSQLISRAKDDAVARIWSAANGGLVYELKGQPDALTSAFFSDDGRHAYTASNNGRDARLWSLATGKEVTKFAGHEGGGLIVTTTSLPDSRWRVSRAAGDKVAQLWDNQSGQHVSRLTGHVGSVRTTKFTKDGKRLLTRADTDPDARLWDIERRGALVRVLGPHRDAVVDVLITKDDSLIVTQAAADPIVRLWDAKTGGPIAELGFRNTAPVSKMFLVNDDTRLMTFSGNVVRLWDIRKYNLSREKEPFQLVCGDGQGLMSKRQFNAVEMRDPILEAFSTQRQPCDRPGPLRWAYWQHLFAAEAEVAK